MNLLIFLDIENCISKYLRTYSSYMMVGPGGRFTKKIFKLRYTLGTSSSSWRNTTGAILCQQTIVTTTSSHSFIYVRKH